MFHGYGADMHDLSGLAPAVPEGGNYRWVFPNGIKQIEIGPAFYGRAWFAINIEEYSKAIQEGRARDLSKKRPAGLDKAIQEAEAFVQTLDVPAEHLVLGGFSQGAMLATELAARRPENIKGVLLLSGNLLDEENLKKLASKHHGQKFYQSHGTHDSVLDYNQAKRLEEMLVASGWQGSLDSFRGGHEIPISVLQNVGHFLKKL
jgi:phospholipase/carboxylesterase